MKISHGKGAMYFSRFFFLVLYLFACQIVALEEWTKSITIRELPSSALRKRSDIDYQILFPDISSLSNIWDESDDESDEEESIYNDCTFYSDNINIFPIKLLE